MNIYDAIMKAADHIERNPDEFRFESNDQPTCGTPGCMLGWVGVYAGIQYDHSRSWAGQIAIALGFPSLAEPLEEFRKIAEPRGWWYVSACEGTDEEHAHNAAKVLREFAKRFRSSIPDWNAIAAHQTVGEHEISQEVA